MWSYGIHNQLSESNQVVFNGVYYMSVLSRLQVKSDNGFVELRADDLIIRLAENEARCLWDWLEQTIGTSVLFLFKVDCPGYEIEGRNYDDYLDFLVFVHKDGEMKARTFIVPKEQVPCLIEKVELAIKTSFRSS